MGLVSWLFIVSSPFVWFYLRKIIDQLLHVFITSINMMVMEITILLDHLVKLYTAILSLSGKKNSKINENKLK